jgi:hypothetical protein
MPGIKLYEKEKKMKNLVILLFLFGSFAANGQNLKGYVFTQKDNAPAQFASVGLLALPDSNMVSGAITLTDGAYSFEKVKPGKYVVKVTYMGHKTESKEVEINPGKEEIVTESIYLLETETTLNEATVIGEKLKGKELVDRTVYSVPAVVAQTSTNGYEILKKVPQVNVDFQNNVTLNGSSNFIIQVDGRQRDKEFLAKLLPTDIESVEIISNPSGRYEGNIDGVINIILKKEARYGMNGNVSLALKPFKKTTTALSGSIDYAMGKITFYTTGYIFSQNLFINNSVKSNFSLLDSTTHLVGNGKIGVMVGSVNSGFDYYMNEKNNLSFNVSIKPINQDIDLNSESLLYKFDNPQNRLLSTTGEYLKSNEATYSLFYKKTFGKAVREFTAEGIYYHFKSDQDNRFTNTRYLYNSDLPLNVIRRLEDNLNYRDYTSLKLDYVHPVGMNTKIETGYQFYYQQLSYELKIDDSQEGNLFEYQEYRHSAYAGITFNLKKIGFQANLRVENSNILTDSVSDPTYTCLLPSMNLQYKFSASQNLKLTYNRRINRPGIYDMNPYWKIGQDYSITTGNPDLRPDYRDRIQLTFTKNFGSNYFSPSIYYEYLSDKVGQEINTVVSPIDGSVTTFTKPYNLLNGYEYGGGINAMLWFVNINARVYKGHFDEYNNIPERDYFSYSINSYAFAHLDKNKKATAFAFISYNGVRVDAQTKTYSAPFYGFGAQKQMKNHSGGIFFLLPFSTDIKLSRAETEAPAITSQNIIGFDVSYYIQFSYSYKFNKGKNVKKLDRKIEIESDSKSQGIGK